MAKRMTQAEKMKKSLDSQVTSEVLDEQIEQFLNSGGEIEQVESGKSGMKSVAERKAIQEQEKTSPKKGPDAEG